MADIDKAVHKVIRNEISMISQAPSKPAFPTTQPKRKYIITPRMVNKVGVNTPPNVPNFFIKVDSSDINKYVVVLKVIII
ncbi:MAG: hypothetical protein Wins2KO_03980 [Winogradskyella sp.]